MRYLSVCSGIEAASVAWRPLGWRALAVAEVDAFPSAVLAHRYPDTPNLGDITAFGGWPDADVSLLVGGTPCQSFSLAGLRKGLADPRGNLALTYLAIADRYRPEWLVWENVPGVLSSGGGRDFGAFLGGLQQLGYGFAYRVLDAQYVRVDGFGRAVPQRRRRVFVVGNSRDWRRAAAVLFEPESLSGHTAPRREAGQGVTGPIAGCSNGGGANGPGRSADDADSLIACEAADTLSVGANQTTGFFGDVVARSLRAQSQPSHRIDSDNYVAHALRADGFDASEDGTGRGTPIIAVADTLVSNGDAHSGFRDEKGIIPINLQVATRSEALGRGTGFGVGDEGEPAYTLSKAHQHAVAFDMRGREGGSQFEGPSDTANVRAASGGSSRSYVAGGWAVRRLTPRECERLQGFPDDYTAVTYRGKPAADGPRYKALGNSMAVNVMRWIGHRIELVQGIVSALEIAA